MKKRREVRFTKAALDKLPIPTAGRVYYHDPKTPMLTLCVTPAGTRTFYLYGRMGGSQPEYVRIGRYPDWTPEQAQRRAAELRGSVASGENPADRRRKARGAMTLGKLFGHYIERAKLDKRTWREDQRRYDTHLSAWKARKLAEITKADVARLHTKIGADAPYEANRTLSLLCTLYNTADPLEYDGPNPARSSKKAGKGIRRFKEHKRARFLFPDELKRFLSALNADETAPVMRDLYSVALLTAARRGNVESMRWDELELGRAEWRIPADKSKNGEPMLVHLPAYIVEILTRRLAERIPNAEYVFPSYGACGHIVDARQAWADIIGRAKLNNIRVHDLRRTLASWAVITGASLHVVGKALGHTDPTATAIYARLTDAPVRDAVNTAAVAMLTAGGVLPPPPADTNGKQGGVDGK